MRLQQLLLAAACMMFLQGLAQQKQKPNAWDHPVIKRLEKHDSTVVAFQRDQDVLVNLAVLSRNDSILYYFTRYGFVFDTLHLASDGLQTLATSQQDAFLLFQEKAFRYINILGAAKEELRAEGAHTTGESAALDAVFNLSEVKKAGSSFQQLLAFESYERDLRNLLAEFDWKGGGAAEALMEKSLKGPGQPRSLTTLKAAGGSICEYINADSLCLIKKAVVRQSSHTIYFYNWQNELADSLVLQPGKLTNVLKEKADVFSLYRGGLEWQLQTTREAIFYTLYAINQLLIQSGKGSAYGAYTSAHSNGLRSSLYRLKEEEAGIERKIQALSNPDRQLLHHYIFAKKYAGQAVTQSWLGTLGWGKKVGFERGRKEYELPNHLGNVLVTLSDKKIQHDDGDDGEVDWYEPYVVSAQDYYPFGMLMPGRQYTSSSNYRYGFNGKENDNEVKGQGNQQDYGMRIYDPRRGRFLSVDPLGMEFPWNSPYAYAENDVIRNIDLDGLEKASPEFVEQVRTLMDRIGNSILTNKDLLTKTTDKTVIDVLNKNIELNKTTYAKLVVFLYKNQASEQEVLLNYIIKTLKYANKGMDFTPVSDVKVIVTGTNFSGEEQSRWAAAGFLLINLMGGEAISASLKGVKTLSKGLKYANDFGKCVEFAAEFTKKYKKVFEKGGVQMRTLEINIGKNGLIGTAEQQFSNNGMHQVVEITKDGKSWIVDNLHPDGMLKDDYLKSLAGHTSDGKLIEGEKLMKDFSKEIKQ